MKIKNLFIFLTLLFCSSTILFAQDISEDMIEEKEEVVYEKSSGLGIIAKKLLTDYNGPIDKQPFDFQKWKSGFELGLRMPLNEHFNLAFPFKASSVSLPESNRNVNILSLDAQAQFFPLQKNTIRLQPYLASGIGAVLETGDDISLAIPMAIGANIHLNKRVDLNIELAYRLGLKTDRNNYQLGIGFVYNLVEIEEIEPVPFPVVVEEVPEPFDHLMDSDGDGVPDIYDLSPGVPGLVELMGAPDSDGDGIPDHLDKCPHEPGPVENHGCPIEEEVVVEPEPEPKPIVREIPEEVQEVLDIAMRDVQFDLGRATLRPESFTVLNQVADIMRDYPQYRLRIHGHTDNIGSAANNQRLSEQRARSCYEYLASRGVSTNRMSFVGFGESRPISPNDTAEGRAQNRRVEFQLYTD
jgi:outer membrane protein OmpA-like peptidoglycan-associated protein